MVTKLIRVDLIQKPDCWAASFAHAPNFAFNFNDPTTAIMRLLASVPELDFLTEKSEVDYARTTDEHLFINIPCEPSKTLIRESLIDEHITSLLKTIAGKR